MVEEQEQPEKRLAFRDRVSVNDVDDVDEQTPTTPSGSSTPAQLSAYQVLMSLGKGAHGQVLLIRNKETRSLYAMKVFKKNDVIKADQVEGTKSERKILESVRHPFIVGLYSAFQDVRYLYLVIEYCPGGELLGLIRKAGKLLESSAQFYGATILLALEELHSRDILYRDLKPENVLLDRDGYAKLSDFGLAKQHMGGRARAHSHVGTEQYWAPEMMINLGYGRPSDWYAFGCLIHEMLVGKPPPDPTQSDTRAQSLIHNWPELSQTAAELLVGLLQEEPNDRLGVKGGMPKLKRHRFFDGIDMEALKKKKVEAPFIPEMPTDDGDLDADLPMTKCSGFSAVSSRTPESHDAFTDFDYNNPEDEVSRKASKDRPSRTPSKENSFPGRTPSRRSNDDVMRGFSKESASSALRVVQNDEGTTSIVLIHEDDEAE